jgi:peptidoglycan/LPS O-acetylase OafA/YrhL
MPELGGTKVIRHARQILGLCAAALFAAYMTKAVMRSHDRYGSTIPWAVDAVFTLALCAPYIALALLPRRERSRRTETLQLVLLLVALGLLGSALYYAETSLGSTAGVWVLYAGVGAWICFGLVSALDERNRNRSSGPSAPPRPD